jgi:preprotein translocase subunit SecA
LERQILLRIIDTRWMDHMQYMDYLKAGIGLRAFGQRDPLSEYKDEAYKAFSEMRDGMFSDYLRTLLRMQIAVRVEQEAEQPEPDMLRGAQLSGPSEETIAEPAARVAARQQPMPTADSAGAPKGMPKPQATAKAQPFVKDKSDPFANVGRNDPCPCGSGKKFKNCHGRNL